MGVSPVENVAANPIRSAYCLGPDIREEFYILTREHKHKN